MAVETTLVEEEDTVVTVEAAELVVELEELPSSVDIPGRDDKSETRVRGLIRGWLLAGSNVLVTAITHTHNDDAAGGCRVHTAG